MMTKNELNIMSTYSDREKYVDNVFDIYTFIKFYTEFQYIKKILLNENQALALKGLKPKYEKEEEDSIRTLKLQEYYEELDKNKCLSSLDSKIFDLMNDEYTIRDDKDLKRSVLSLNTNIIK